jgi:chemotaxis methyl-accepting protein methylase
LRRKLALRLEGLGLREWEGYAALVEADPVERQELAGLLGVTISRFWRNYSLWEYLAAHVLPGLCEAGARAFWSCGCAGGEEPYSLALLWRERCPASPLDLLATDIDRAVLERAAEGLYAPGSLRELPPELRERYFRPERGGFRLSGEVKGMVRFRRHDLLREPPPEAKPFDLILCRNLAFTYFGPEARVEAARKLAAALAPGGWLAVGRKERLPEAIVGLVPADYPGLYQVRAPGPFSAPLCCP